MLSPKALLAALALIGGIKIAFASPLFADKPERSLTSTEELEAEPKFSWERDRPYGVLGFPGRHFGPHWEFLRLATHPPVQEELDLSPEQIERLTPVYQGLMAAQGDWRDGERRPELFKAEYEAARRILTEEQGLRIEQIQLQRRGVQAFLHADVQETLNMDEKQIAKIREVWTIHVANAKDGWKGDEGRRSYHNVWKLALGTLSESQRHDFYEMTGPIIRER